MDENQKQVVESAVQFLVEPPDTGEIRLNNWHDACIHINELLKVIEALQGEIDHLNGSLVEDGEIPF